MSVVPNDTELNVGQLVLGHAELGDQRRTKRLVAIFELMRKHPGGTLPDKLSSPADLRAFYRLCDQEEVTHSAIIAAARKHTLEQIEARGRPVLAIHDATELDYTSITSLTGELGQIGQGFGQGYICHNSLAVDAETGEVIGLLDQVLHRRDKVSKKETMAQRRARETRESLLWLEGTRNLPASRQFIDVCDRASDTFEFLEHEVQSGRRFVIRASRVRKVSPGHDPQAPRTYLSSYVRQLPELGRFTMDVQAQGGREKRKARKNAEFIVRGGAVTVHRPHAKYGNHGNEPLRLYVVHVVEVNPPHGEKPVSWTLLTNEPVHTFEDAWRVIGWYELRWVIEELHKAKKTGCGIEDMQFCTTARLEPAIALLSLVAVTLLDLRDASRRPDAKQRRADTVIAPDYIEVLSIWRYKQARPDLTVYEFFLALARLGGHQNRKSDHPPGWLVLWRGWTKLQSMLDGFDIATHARKRAKKCGIS
jgi:hypothetical protein